MNIIITKYLSEATCITPFLNQKFNFINAPPGAGKSRYAATKLGLKLMHQTKKNSFITWIVTPTKSISASFIRKYGTLSLREDKNQIHLLNYEYTQDELILKLRNPNKATNLTIVGTVQHFVLFAENNFWIWNHIDALIIDEADLVFNRQAKWPTSHILMRNFAKNLKGIIERFPKLFVIGISATGTEAVRKIFPSHFHAIKYKEKLKELPYKEIRYFAEKEHGIELGIKLLKQGKKVAFFAEQIRNLGMVQKRLRQENIESVMLLSDNRYTEQEIARYKKEQGIIIDMRDKQIKHEITLKGFSIDEKIALLFNLAVSRGIDIYSHYDAIIILDTNKDEAIQAAARFRKRTSDFTIFQRAKRVEINDSERFYLPNNFDEKWANQFLYKEKKEVLFEYLNWRNNNGGLYKWKKVSEILMKQFNYNIIEMRKTVNGKQRSGHIIEKKEEINE